MDSEDGQPCPDCNSDEISIFETRQIIWARNYSTGKVIRKNKGGLREHWTFKYREYEWMSKSLQE